MCSSVSIAAYGCCDNKHQDRPCNKRDCQGCRTSIFRLHTKSIILQGPNCQYKNTVKSYPSSQSGNRDTILLHFFWRPWLQIRSSSLTGLGKETMETYWVQGCRQSYHSCWPYQAWSNTQKSYGELTRQHVNTPVTDGRLWLLKMEFNRTSFFVSVT